ncbi:hypothetical protein [Pseudomonas sp. PA27(2017)]|uniref:hypothetical protein n=1 Tax=Pseudomonas sp. PA27(2017) TaxID=1932112 RepID=UPI00095F56D3|nr:hypothetical protein [Pseudomonas sp. PA27(2017)]OLU35447.1 hypothetical protein BVH06_03555 [Pseudomonas sp. PA27(2017)]
MRYAALHPLNLLNRINRNACIALTAVASFTILAGCVANDESESGAISTSSPMVSTSTKLSPLNESDITGNPVKGELVCTFSAGRSTFFYVAGNVATKGASEGILKFGDQVMKVHAPGGFDSMQHGNLFKGERVVAEVKLKEKADQPEKAGTDGAASFPAATLTYIRNDSSMRAIEGDWVCGP